MQYLLILLIGTPLILVTNGIGGRPPNYSQDQMPTTSFSCRDKIIGGYYADPETQCQMFHVCVKVPGLGVQDYKFLCPNDTSFDQENQICDDWYNIDCEASTLYYSDNFDLYRIGSDLGGGLDRGNLRVSDRNINNAVSDVDDSNYLQRSDRGENVGADLLRGSHSGHFFLNKHRGREEEDLKDELNKKKKTGNKNQVKKLLTGKRPVSSENQVTYQNNNAQVQPSARPNFTSRNRGGSNFQRNQPVSETPQRQTEVYNNQKQSDLNNNNYYNNNNNNNYYNNNNKYNNNQRNFYTPTTPKIDTTTTQRTDYFKNNFYNPVTQQNLKVDNYDNPQSYSSQPLFSQTNKNFVTSTTKFPANFQTTRNYQNYNPVTTSSPVTINSQAPERINNYETQKLFKLNTASYNNNQNQYDDSKDDEFLKTAHSQNLGASNFNRVKDTLKNWNATVAANYNFFPATTLKPSTAFQQNYNPTTIRPSIAPFQSNNFNAPQNNYYSQSTTQKPYQQSQINNFIASSTLKPQQSPTNFVTTSTPGKTFSQQYNSFFSSTTLKPFQQTAVNYYTPSSTQKTTVLQNNANTIGSTKNHFYSSTVAPTTYKQRNNLYTQNNAFQDNSLQKRPSPNSFQEQRKQDYSYNTYATTPQYTTTKSRSRGAVLYTASTDATENPRPFTTLPHKQVESKDKDQYDYAYYDDGGAQAAEYDIDHVDFARTKSKSRS